MKKVEAGLWILAIFVIAIAIYEFYDSQRQISEFNWTPLYEPISLLQANEANFEFTADKDTTYYIYFDVERKKEFNELKCLIGAAFKQNECHEDSAVIDIEWKIKNNDSLIASGTADTLDKNHSYWTQTIGKGIGAFKAKNGLTYQLYLKINKPLKEVMVLRPKIKVAMHPRVFKEAQMAANMTGLITVSLIAFIVLVIAAFYFYKEYRIKNKHPAS